MGGRGKTLMDEIRHGRPLAVDPDAQSASPTEPACPLVEKFREKYGAKDVKKYYSKFDVAVAAKLG